MTNPQTPLDIELATELRRHIDAFHDAVPQAQGETGDGGVAGKALCQWVYDNAEAICASLTPTLSPLDREAVARIVTAFAGWDKPDQQWMSATRAESLAKADAILALLPAPAQPLDREAVATAATILPDGLDVMLWLIERDDGRWIVNMRGDATDDANEAIKFSTERECNEALVNLPRIILRRSTFRATEHMWTLRTIPPAQPLAPSIHTMEPGQFRDPPEGRADVREAIRKAKVEADKTYGIAWHHLEEVSRFELFLAALPSIHTSESLVEALQSVGRLLLSIEDTVPIAKEAQRIILAALTDTGDRG